MVIEGETFYVYVLKRPGVDEFLEEMSKFYEVVIYTASLSIYADPLLDEIDPNNYANYRLFREHCTFYNNAFVKDLSQLGRDLKDVLIVDNSPASYALQPENAMPILTWIDDPNDNKLFQLAPILELLSKVYDVRPYIHKIVKDDKINYLQAFKILRMEEERGRSESLEKAAPMVDCWVEPGDKVNRQSEPSPPPKKSARKEAHPRPISQLLVSEPNFSNNNKSKKNGNKVHHHPYMESGPMTPQYKGSIISCCSPP